MKTMVRLAVLALTLLAVAVPASAAVADGLVAPYLHIQVALANDSTNGVVEAARAIGAQAEKMGEKAAEIGAAAETLAAAGDLQTARDAFGPLSDALIAYGKEVGFGELRVAYCPMVDKEWVQATSEIRNPFYGSMMLTCGEFR
jgi:Cu(I)/Ag(I) efflux system membrane fusion protein